MPFSKYDQFLSNHKLPYNLGIFAVLILAPSQTLWFQQIAEHPDFPNSVVSLFSQDYLIIKVNGYILVYHNLMLKRYMGFFLCCDVHSIFYGTPSILSNGTIFLLQFSNMVLPLICHLHLALGCKMCGCLFTCPVYYFVLVCFGMRESFCG